MREALTLESRPWVILPAYSRKTRRGYRSQNPYTGYDEPKKTKLDGLLALLSAKLSGKTLGPENTMIEDRDVK